MPVLCSRWRSRGLGYPLHIGPPLPRAALNRGGAAREDLGSGIVRCGHRRRSTQTKYRAISVSGIIALAAISPGQRIAAAMAKAAMMPKTASLIQFMPAISSLTGAIRC